MGQEQDQDSVKPRIDFGGISAAKKDEADERRKAESQLRNDVRRVSETEAGRNVFRSLMTGCGFHSLGVDCNKQTGETLAVNAVYLAARRDIWLAFRQLIPYADLVQIELPPPPPVKPKQEEDEYDD